MKDFPNFSTARQSDILGLLRYILKERPNDVRDWDNLPNRFISGRKVGKIPSASNDVTDDDRVGDFNYDASYIYILIDNAGTAAWRRATLGSW